MKPNKTKELILRKEAMNDIYEIWNNILDDLGLDFETGNNGYSTYKESWKALHKYTLKVIERKARKWRNRVPIKEIQDDKRTTIN